MYDLEAMSRKLENAIAIQSSTVWKIVVQISALRDTVTWSALDYLIKFNFRNRPLPPLSTLAEASVFSLFSGLSRSFLTMSKTYDRTRPGAFAAVLRNRLAEACGVPGGAGEGINGREEGSGMKQTANRCGCIPL